MAKTVKKESGSTTKVAEAKSRTASAKAAKPKKSSGNGSAESKPAPKPSKRAAIPSPDTIKEKPAARTRKEPVRTKQVATSNPISSPSSGDIATRAYQIFLERGGSHGADIDDWLEAERQLTGT